MTATQVREIREELGLSQYELADKLGVTQAAVSLWESGRRLPSTTVVKLLQIIRDSEKRRGGKKST